MFSLNSRKLLSQAVEKWPAKVLSVAVALILLVFHRMSSLESRFFSVPLRLEAGTVLAPASPYAQVVRVTMRGDANSIFPILEEDIEAYIDLRKIELEGQYRLPVQVRKHGSAVGVEPLEISVDPLEISLTLERKVGKTIPVIPNFHGRVESGFDLVSQSLTPSTVLAEGPASLIESLGEFQTGPIDLEGRNGDFTLIVNILNRDPLVAIRGNGMAEFRAQVRRSLPALQPFPLADTDGDGEGR
jgi:hypothetical protein